MAQVTNKFKMCGSLAAILLAAWVFVSCGNAQKTEATEATPITDTLETLTVPDSLPDAVDSNAKTRPEPRKTR